MRRNSFVTGANELFILLILSQKDRYTYEIPKIISEASGGAIDIPYATIYPIIYKMKEKGYLSGYDVLENRKVRVVLHIEAPGKEYLQELKKDYETVLKTVSILSHTETKDSGNKKHETA